MTLPYESNQRWQAQFQLQNLGGVSTQAGTNYDFSIKLKANQDLNSATVKLTDATDDTNFYFDEVIPLEAETEYLLVKSNMEGKDIASMHLVFDFGGCQAGTVVEITDMVLKDHAYDDGAGQPDEGGGQGGEGGNDKFDWNYDSASNLWKAVDDGSMFDEFGYYFAAGDDWHAIDYTEVTHNGDTYELTLPADLGSNQWQGQFHIDTKLTASAEKKYNFYMIMESDQDLPQVTFKLTDAGDTNFFIEERNDVAGGEPFILKREGVTLKEGTDAEAIRLFFDFGGSPGGANVKISKIYFEEADGSGDGGGSETSPMNYTDADNLWKAIDDNSAYELGYYFAAGDDWHSIEFTEATHSGDTYAITLPADNGKLQWQSQFHIDTKLTASAAKTYDFQFTIETDDDCPLVTMKLTDAGDTNWFVEERNNVIGGEPLTFTWSDVALKEGADAEAIRFFLDFGGSPGGTSVKISQIIFREHR